MKQNTKSTVKELKEFMYGLYSPQMMKATGEMTDSEELPTWKLYDEIDSEPIQSTEYKPDDLSFSCDGEEEFVYVYGDEDERKFVTA